MKHDAPRHKVLLIEDDVFLLASLTRMFSQKGFSVTTTTDGHDAISLIQQKDFDLIISDINMPGMNGFALREKLLALEPAREIPFIFLTARSMPEDQIRGLRQKIDEYMIKPILPEIMFARIEAVLERRKCYLEQVKMDSLTRLLSRNWLKSEIRNELQKQGQSGGIGSFVFIDIDDFKQINDKFGHSIGDQVLIELASALKNTIRNKDILGRYAGDEFIVYFLNTRHSEALLLILKMQHIFISGVRNSLEIETSFSAGIAQSPRHGRRYQLLFEKADSAMYQAKDGGKGRILTWDEEQ